VPEQREVEMYERTDMWRQRRMTDERERTEDNEEK
jgi:hypothetical protein